jgi:hypothetical protein
MKPCACEAQLDIRPSCIDEMQKHGAELFKAHYEEIATNKSCTKLDPAWHQYHALEDAGMLFVLAVWQQDKLCGYSINLLIPEHLHYRDLRYVQNDVLFVAKDYRYTSAGGRLMRATKVEASKRGASRILWHCKQGSLLHHILDKREGCIVQDIIYSEVL